MECPKCGQKNDTSYQFCMQCGNQLLAPTLPAAPQMSSPAASGPHNVYTSPSAAPIDPLTSPEKTISLPSVIGKMGAESMTPVNMWGPFAGFGTRRSYRAWLMDNQGDQADSLVAALQENFKEREIPNTTIGREMLTAKGIIVENRPFFILRRGLTSMALYVAQFGNDLFISLAAYLKPPISQLRVLIVSAMIFVGLYMTFVYPAAVDAAFSDMLGGFGNSFFGGGGSSDGLATLLCVVGPIGLLNNLALFLFLLYSLYKWFTEKDFLAGLRTRPNEFDEDDLNAMNNAVEQTVRIGLDQIGLDAKALKRVGGFSRNEILF